MNDPRPIWLLVSGEYSDYRVNAVFTTQAAADEAAALDDDARVEQGDLYDTVPAQVTLHFVNVVCWDDGRTEHREHTDTRYPWNHWTVVPKGAPFVRFVRAPVYGDAGGRLEVHGTNKRAVNKVVTERLAMIRAHIDQTGKAGPEVNR